MAKTSVSLATKRQLCYSAVSLLAAPFLVISIGSTDDLVTWVGDKGELPFDTLLFIGLSEFLKVSWVLWLFPRPNFQDSETTLFAADEDKKGRYRLPTSIGKDPRLVSKTGLLTNLLEKLWGLAGFICSLFICHLILVLFGAPFLQDWALTLQLSFVIVCWLFFPMCLVLRPDTILPELFYISMWDYDEHGLLVVAKWRFLLTCIGVWIGAIVVPLDWDRPWQKWPIPCLFSATIAQLLINLCMCLYFTPKACFKLVKGKASDKVKAI